MSPSEHLREAEDVIITSLRSLGRHPDPAALKHTLDTCRASLDRVQGVYETGSQDAIADCQRRRREAMRSAQSDPRFRTMTRDEARAARDEAPLEEPVEYETNHEGDETDGN